jgi:hypothetical protein
VAAKDVDYLRDVEAKSTLRIPFRCSHAHRLNREISAHPKIALIVECLTVLGHVSDQLVNDRDRSPSVDRAMFRFSKDAFAL